MRNMMQALLLTGFIVCIFFGYFSYRLSVSEKKFETYAATNGKIETSSIQATFESNNNVANEINSGQSRFLELVVKYSYSVQGKDYQGTRVSNSASVSRELADKLQGYRTTPSPQLEALAEEYKAGTEVTVHYDANHPEQSYLIIDHSGSTFFFYISLVGLLIFLVGVVYQESGAILSFFRYTR